MLRQLEKLIIWDLEIQIVGETLTLTADSTDGKATDFKIGGAFYYDDYDNTLSEGIGRRKDIQICLLYTSDAADE